MITHSAKEGNKKSKAVKRAEGGGGGGQNLKNEGGSAI